MPPERRPLFPWSGGGLMIPENDVGGIMQLPQTLYGQLYLLAYDRNRHRFDIGNSWLLGFGLRAAMLTELLQGGYLVDIDGKAARAHDTDPRDPLLRSMFRSVDIHGQTAWSWMISADQDQAAPRVRNQL